MGQQQLLLVILVTIIVGIATVVAINVFGSSAENANADAIRQDLLTVSAAADGWFIKPEILGGGGGTFVGMNFRDIGFSYEAVTTGTAAIPTGVTNANATYTIATPTADGFVVNVTDPSAYQGTATLTYTRVPATAGDPRAAIVLTPN